MPTLTMALQKFEATEANLGKLENCGTTFQFVSFIVDAIYLRGVILRASQLEATLAQSHQQSALSP